MKDLKRFWRSFERVAGLQAIPAFWQEYCGPHFDLVRPYLRATNTIGGVYPCPHPSPGHCPRRIVDYSDGQYAAICRDPHKVCPDVPLETRDVLVHELELAGFTEALAKPVGFGWQQPRARGDGTWAIGTSVRPETRGQPVFLIVLPATARFRAAVERLLFDVPGPFVIVAHTNNHRNVEVQEHLQRRGLGFLALEDAVGLSDDWEFVALNPDSGSDQPLPTPVEDRQRTVKEFALRHKCRVKDIQVAVGADEADYYKWLHGKIPDHYSGTNEKENLTPCGEKRVSRRSPRKSSGSSAAESWRQTDGSLGERLLDSIKELRAHVRGEIHLSETAYPVRPETDVRALREKLGLSFPCRYHANSNS